MNSWPPWLIGVTVVALIVALFGIPITLGLYGYRAYKCAAERRVDALFSRLFEINGPISRHYVDMYTYFGFLAWATQHSMRIYLTIENVNEVDYLARKLRSFTLRWGILAKGAVFIPLITWWNYRSVFMTIHLFRHSV